MDWLALSLLCAFSLASADAATKAWLRDYSARELALVRFSVTGLLLAPMLFVVGIPDPLPAAFWAWLALLLPLEITAMLLYMRAIRDHPLSLTLPYLAFTPVFVVLSGRLLLGERIEPRGLAGILLVVCGAWLLNARHANRRNWRSWASPLAAILYEPGSRTMLAVAAIYSLTASMGKAAMHYMTPETFGPFYFFVLGVATLLLFGGHRPRLLKSMWRRPAAGLLVALLTGVMVVTHFLAIQQVQVAYMISVKRTSLLFGILYGAVFFREHNPGAHLFGGGLMVAGVFLIVLSRGI